MKKIIFLSFFILFILLSATSYAQDIDTSSSYLKPEFKATKQTILERLSLSISLGRNLSIPVSKLSFQFSVEFEIYRKNNKYINLEHSAVAANNYNESTFGKDYQGNVNAPENATKATTYSNGLITLGGIYNWQVKQNLVVGVGLGLGYCESAIKQIIIIPYYNSNGERYQLKYGANYTDTYFGGQLSGKIKYQLRKKTTFQLQVIAVKNSVDLPIQIPVMAGFIYKLK